MSQSISISLALKNAKFLKLLGLSCFSVENGRSVTKLTDVLCMLTSISIGVFVCYYSVNFRNELAMQNSKITSVGNFLSFLGSVIIVVLSVFITFLFRHKLWSLAFKLDSIEEKAQTTLKLANEMMKRSHDMNKTLMLVTFTTLVKKRKPKFTCGLFDFDWKLVFANISSAATNFVILMQFDMASKR
ncbi:hypothetical protein PVAND_003628 [Polypedilum vanderplanki]|uniref:Gustatory receptor n=1 Tax=Polypedilum vanderplanki TaxID=319348 RepID=A0A9J6BUM8_POLVA|nr:hypothetical protein PVAND_003628 [Polypedilum vanderplanki]